MLLRLLLLLLLLPRYRRGLPSNRRARLPLRLGGRRRRSVTGPLDGELFAVFKALHFVPLTLGFFDVVGGAVLGSLSGGSDDGGGGWPG